MAAFDLSAPAWTFDEASGQWYLHLFEAAQPDLNWDEPEVVGAMHDVLRFWLDRGVDGFRADVIHCIGKDPELPDDPPPVAGIPHSALNDVPVTHERLRDIRSAHRLLPRHRVIVGEVYLLSTAAVATYYGDGDELHLAFNFPPLYARWQGDRWRAVHRADRRGTRPERCLAHLGALQPRQPPPPHPLRPGRGGRGEDRPTAARRSEARARAAAVLLLTLRGTPFLYQGEELGLLDAVIPGDRRVDPGGRDGCRAPIPWDGTADHGWPVAGGATPGSPSRPRPTRRNHADLADDAVIHPPPLPTPHRPASPDAPALSVGAFELLDVGEGLLGFRRNAGADEWTVVVNFTDAEVPLDDGHPSTDRTARRDVERRRGGRPAVRRPHRSGPGCRRFRR